MPVLPTPVGSQTDFTALLGNVKNVWVKRAWKHAREHSFIMQFTGTGMNSMCQRITELTKTEKGDHAVIRLVPDLVGDGTTGDNVLLGNEEALEGYDTKIEIDQLRHAVKNKGRMNDQRSVFNFRMEAKDKLGFWLARIVDELAFLSLAGVTWDKALNGADRPVGKVGHRLQDLDFAPANAGAAAYTAKRHFRWSKAAGRIVEDQDTAALTSADTLTYNALLEARALMKDRYIRGIRSKGGEEFYHVFLPPLAYLRLKQDPEYQAALRHAMPRSAKNPLFSGNSVMMDGMILHEHHKVFNTSGAAAGSKWGTGGNVDGARISICGAQALAMASLDGASGHWDEEKFDYNNSCGISLGKIFGFLRPKFIDKKIVGQQATEQDFGTCILDVAI